MKFEKEILYRKFDLSVILQTERVCVYIDITN